MAGQLAAAGRRTTRGAGCRVCAAGQDIPTQAAACGRCTDAQGCLHQSARTSAGRAGQPRDAGPQRRLGAPCTPLSQRCWSICLAGTAGTSPGRHHPRMCHVGCRRMGRGQRAALRGSRASGMGMPRARLRASSRSPGQHALLLHSLSTPPRPTPHTTTTTPAPLHCTAVVFTLTKKTGCTLRRC